MYLISTINFHPLASISLKHASSKTTNKPIVTHTTSFIHFAKSHGKKITKDCSHIAICMFGSVGSYKVSSVATNTQIALNTWIVTNTQIVTIIWIVLQPWGRGTFKGKWAMLVTSCKHTRVSNSSFWFTYQWPIQHYRFFLLQSHLGD